MPTFPATAPLHDGAVCNLVAERLDPGRELQAVALGERIGGRDAELEAHARIRSVEGAGGQRIGGAHAEVVLVDLRAAPLDNRRSAPPPSGRLQADSHRPASQGSRRAGR